MSATVVPFKKREEVIDPRKELRLHLLDILVLQDEIGGSPIPLSRILGGSTRNLCGETQLREILRDLSTGDLMRCEYGRVTITEAGREHFYAHSPREKRIRRAVIRALREAPGGTNIMALRIRDDVRNTCLIEAEIEEEVYKLADVGVVDWPNFIANIRLTGNGLVS